MTLSEEIEHYASCNLSMRMTAKYLNLPYHKIKHMVKDLGLRHLFDAKKYTKDCKGGGRPGCGRKKGVKVKTKKRISDEALLRDVARFRTMGMFDAMSDYSTTTVRRRFGSFTAAREIVSGRME